MKLVKNKYCDLGVAVVSVDLLESTPNLDLSGETCVADKIQDAINLAHENGGGVIYLPEGKYKLEKQLEIKSAVTLLGEFFPPEQYADHDNNYSKGTILCCYHGRNSDDPQILMKACTTIANMTIYYPEQNEASAIPYSPAIKQNGSNSMNVHNVALINPYTGISCGPDANELHFIKNVYISPIHIGVFMDMTTDIGRMQHLKISPEYHEKFTGKSIREYMFSNATGVFMARSDWEYGYDIYVEGCKTGFLITAMKDSGPNTQLSSVHIHNCDIGLHLVNVNPYGVALSDSKITNDFTTNTAILTDNTFRTIAQFNAVDIDGDFHSLITHTGSGQLSFVDCSFNSSGEIVQNGVGNGLSLINCKFPPESILKFAPDIIGGAQIIGCENLKVPEHAKLL